MKRILSAIAILLALTFASGIYAHEKMMRQWEQLPNVLGLSARQRASYNVYLHDMHVPLMKAHQDFINTAQKILTKQQFEQLGKDIKAMRHHPKNDEEVEKVVDQESNKLLLTTNQSQKMLVAAKTFHHKAWQGMKNFETRLNKTLSKSQQEKLAKFMEKCD